jgi:proteasome lid subunit RPN8/RPN11
MPRENKNADASGTDSGASGKIGSSDGASLEVKDWENVVNAMPGEFPGPSHVDVPLRVAFEREAYADLIYHTRSSLEAEICGVLVGNVKRDHEGLFVHVGAIIRGDEARRGSAHVTFTQETWNHIHDSLERDYPDNHILGWYHTHPGFGVAFSDMDLFIQKHFFSLPTQIALVTDPLSGETAISINSDDGPSDLPRFWVDGREISCRLRSDVQGTSEVAPPSASKEYQTLETRISQFMRNEDERRTRLYSTLMFLGMMVLSLIVVGVGYFMYKYYTADPQVGSQKIQDFGSIPITFQIDGKTIVLNLQVQGVVIPSGADMSKQERPAGEKKQQTAGGATDGTSEK